MRRHSWWCVAALALAAFVPSQAFAGAFATIGPRIGFSSGPDQIQIGGQLGVTDVAPDLDFIPNVDLGFGDHATVISLNGDFHYRLTIENVRWQPYFGAGVALNFVSFDNPGPFADDNSTDAGGSLILGADVPTKTGSRFFTEMKLGMGDTADFKLLAGWSFALR